MAAEVVFETHSWSEDNDSGVASGWRPGRLSPRGRDLAIELGRRRRDGVDVVLSSDLRRAAETAELAFPDGTVPILYDWRLRKCDYGDGNGMPAAQLHEHRERHLDEPYPNGESWRQAVRRVSGALRDIAERWDGQRVLIIGHVATRWALDHLAGGVPLEELITADFGWREGWEYRLTV
ncbi:histidine phosphatase family protein [Dactylosporangium vinaceum]|uniref:phosphoglycerate mutase (2,3-diphosphoglycerate-dependent) n=1 Tax=Dactylosporangium vinaceum TaxID=53362 RepID=A0ABV5MAE0_9ACTN|nr:histidine phosphatase family protein [Dactylosporangium vinaceum]UAB93156.1 histidine phosphatase family protein [Dactylosporangium vinaceum]